MRTPPDRDRQGGGQSRRIGFGSGQRQQDLADWHDGGLRTRRGGVGVGPDHFDGFGEASGPKADRVLVGARDHLAAFFPVGWSWTSTRSRCAARPASSIHGRRSAPADIGPPRVVDVNMRTPEQQRERRVRHVSIMAFGGKVYFMLARLQRRKFSHCHFVRCRFPRVNAGLIRVTGSGTGDAKKPPEGSRSSRPDPRDEPGDDEETRPAPR